MFKCILEIVISIASNIINSEILFKIRVDLNWLMQAEWKFSMKQFKRFVVKWLNVSCATCMEWNIHVYEVNQNNTLRFLDKHLVQI